MIEAITADNLSGLVGLRHGFFMRNGGISEGIYASLNCSIYSDDNQDDVAENRKRVAGHLGAEPGNLLSCRQVHSADVIRVTGTWTRDNLPHLDAMVTKEKGIALGILTADCGPVLFADPVAGVIGAAHAGWKGAVGGVLENTVNEMEALGAMRGNICAAIGPCIWQDSYEVGPEFPEPFLKEDKANRDFFSQSSQSGHFMFDLPGYIFHKLGKAGIKNIAPSPADTFADERRFFSYRRICQSQKKGIPGLISAIMLEN